ncbi:MAG: alpha-amylase family glycosyl hydrolase [Anaeroplasma sp.]
MKKIIILFALLLCITPIISCKNNSDKNKEFIIKDINLTQSEVLDDNYRVFYEIFTGSFSDSNNDGIGDLQGIINRLDYLNDGDINSGKSLGIQGIWLTPIFASPTYHKYDTTNYYKIDESFGTMEDLKKLIEECHKRDIKLIIDLVINHTGTSNIWFTKFQNAQKSGDTSDPYYDFYCYYKSGDPIPSGRSFAQLVGTNLYYEANFSNNMPELNFDNSLVREEVLKLAKYYLDMGIDGFRFDAAKYIYYGDDKKSAEFWNWYMGELKAYKPDIYCVGEVWSPDQSTYIYFENGLNCFSFSTSGAEGSIASTAKKNSISVYTKQIENYLNSINKLNDSAMMHPFISNHDMDRASGFVTLATFQAHMAANLYLLSSGSPFIYYGEEIGIKGYRGGASSDANRRLAMLWGDDDTIEDPKEATYKKEKQTNGTVATHIVDEASLYNHYKKLIMIRNANPEIARGEYKALLTQKNNIGGFTSTYNDSTVCVFHNTSSTATEEIDLSTITNFKFNEVRAYVGQGKANLNGNILTIEPLTSVVLK